MCAYFKRPDTTVYYEMRINILIIILQDRALFMLVYSNSLEFVLNRIIDFVGPVKFFDLVKLQTCKNNKTNECLK